MMESEGGIMANAKTTSKSKKAAAQSGNMAGPVYGLGLIGAAVYYVQIADGIGEVLVALLKAILWPAYFVYEVLKYVVA